MLTTCAVLRIDGFSTWFFSFLWSCHNTSPRAGLLQSKQKTKVTTRRMTFKKKILVIIYGRKWGNGSWAKNWKIRAFGIGISLGRFSNVPVGHKITCSVLTEFAWKLQLSYKKLHIWSFLNLSLLNQRFCLNTFYLRLLTNVQSGRKKCLAFTLKKKWMQSISLLGFLLLFF